MTQDEPSSWTRSLVGSGALADLRESGYVTFSITKAVALQADGRIVAAGGGSLVDTPSALDFALARYLPDGTLDASFGVGGKVLVDVGGPGSAQAMALQLDGNIITAGRGGIQLADFALVRLIAPRDTAALVDPSTGIWHLRSAAGVVTSFYYGNPGDSPLAGDWDCNGTDTPGMYRQSDGFVYVRNSNTQGIADTKFFLGNPGDVPLAGDFNGDGCDTVSIYRPNEQRFYIANKLAANNAGIVADFSFLFGNPGDKPVTGDWDADGITEIGLHRETSGFFYWRNTLDTGIASDEIFFGDPRDRFVAGDWGIVDGVDTPAIYRPSALRFYFRHSLTQGIADSVLTWSNVGSTWLPVAGAFGLG